MPIKWKADVLAELKAAGLTAYKLRQRKILGEATIQKLRTGELVSYKNLGRICAALGCQPGDLLQWIEGDQDKADAPDPPDPDPDPQPIDQAADPIRQDTDRISRADSRTDPGPETTGEPESSGPISLF